jgi:DNA-binding MltR family transcriptional regulator
MPPPGSTSVKPNGNDSTERKARQDQVLEELATESDRGCILVGASVLSDFLEEILRTALVTNSHAMKHAVIPLFGPMAPLSTFSAKTKLAYGLGLIPMDCFTDLEKIRRIRNVAAHEYSAMSFENQEIIEITRTLEGANHGVRSILARRKEVDANPQKEVDMSPQVDNVKPRAKLSKERMRFIITVGHIAGFLEGSVMRRTRPAKSR